MKMMRLSPALLTAMLVTVTVGPAVAQVAPNQTTEGSAPPPSEAPQESGETVPSSPPSSGAIEPTPPSQSPPVPEEPPAVPPNDPPEPPAPVPNPAPVVQPSPEDDYAEVVEPESVEGKKAQHGKDAPFILGVFYDTALPLANTADFTKKFSGRGLSVEARYRGLGFLRLGAAFSYQDFLEKRDTTFQAGRVTIGGVQIRETTVTNLTANVGIAWNKKRTFVPYVTLGLGPSRLWRRLDMGIGRYTWETWHFALVPEIGVEVPMKRFMVLGAIRYNQLFKSGGAPGQSYLNFSVGIGFE